MTTRKPRGITPRLRRWKRRLLNRSRISYVAELIQSRNRPNAVFIWIPKTAGTSVWRALGASKLNSPQLATYRFANRGTVTFGHMDYSRLVSEGIVSSDFDESAFKFTFVRNPYERAVSLYSYLLHSDRIPADATFLDYCRIMADCSPIGLYSVRKLSVCNPQVRWLENISLDYIGRTESIDRDMEQISARLGLAIPHVPHENKSIRSSCQDYYCRESVELVQDFYKEDFREFGYSLELPTG